MKPLYFFLLLILPFIGKAQPGTEIYLLDMIVKNKQIELSHPVNITNHKGYDNQPCFFDGKPLIFYTSGDSGKTDIKTYNYETGVTNNFTSTLANEYSPTVTPDKKYISCIIGAKQDLGKYPLEGGAPIILINHLKVGYHVWIDNDRLLLFVLDDSANNSLHYYNLTTKEDQIIAKNPGRSLHKIPDEDAISFVEKSATKEWMIKKFNYKTMSVSTIVKTIQGQEYLAWTKQGSIIMSDGLKLFYYEPAISNDWKAVILHDTVPAMKGMTRIAMNAVNNKIAIVVSE